MYYTHTHSYDVLYTTDDKELTTTMWRILDNRNRRLKARWNKAKATMTKKTPGPRDKGYLSGLPIMPSPLISTK